MKLIFRGTRGNIKAKSARHRRHTSTMICYRGSCILIDFGADWAGTLLPKEVRAIFISHAHPDHVDGLKRGVHCPIFATAESWEVMKNFAIEERCVLKERSVVQVGALAIEPFAVEHALNAPAVGYRITGGSATIFYVPDLVKIRRQAQALRNVDLYIGDGAVVSRYLLVRSRDGQHIGHSPIAEQLKWCAKAGIRRMVVTHCGTEITSGLPDEIERRLHELGREFGVQVLLACDGMELAIRGGGR